MSESHHLCRPRTSCHHISRLRPAWVPDLFRACPKATAISTDLVIPATPAPPHPTYPLRIWSGRDPSRLSPDDLPRDARGIIMSLVMRSDPSDVTFPVTRFLEAHNLRMTALTATYFRSTTIVGLRDIDAFFEDGDIPPGTLLGSIYTTRPRSAHGRIAAHDEWLGAIRYHDRIISHETGIDITSTLSTGPDGT